MNSKITLIIAFVVIFCFGFLMGTFVGINRNNREETKVETTINTIEIEEIKEEKPDYKLNRYELLANTKTNLQSSFSQEKYNIIIDSIYNYEKTVNFDDFNVEYYKDLALNNNIFTELLVESTSVENNGKTLFIEYKYKTKVEHEEKLKEAEDIIKDVLINAIANEANDFEKVLNIYKYWIQNIDYDYNTIGANKIEKVLFEHKGTYQNFAKMINYTLSQLEIESYSITGDTIFGEAHEWNLVKMYDNYYQIDATFEKRTTNGKGLVYFGRTKQDMLDEGRVFSEWVDGFEYELFSDKESNNLNLLKDAVEYKLEDHILTLYNAQLEEYATINTQNLEVKNKR